MILLVQLFIAHLAGDFFLQPDAWILDKKARKLRSPYLYLHTLIHFLLILAVVGRMDFWMPALVLALAQDRKSVV